MQDIYDADVAGGWGVVQKIGNVYIFEASLYIEGSGTYFKDSGFVLGFQGDISDTYTVQIRNTSNVNLSNWLCHHEVNSKGFLFLSDNITIKDCAFTNVKYPRVFAGSYENINMIDCYYGWFNVGNLSVNYMNVEGTNRGIWIQSSATLNNINVKNFNRGLILRESATIRNIKMYNVITNYEFYFSNSTPQIFNLINSQIDIDSYTFTFAEVTNYTLNLQSTFRIHINQAANATAKLYDQHGTLIEEGTLDGDGKWNLADPVTYASRYVETDGSSVVENTKTVHEPFKLVVTKTGYQDLEIDNIYCTVDGVGQLSPTVVEGKMIEKNYIDRRIDASIEETKINAEVEAVTEITAEIIE
jgi:hypothetical protein